MHKKSVYNIALLIVLLTFVFLTIGYSAFGAELSITGSNVTVRVKKDIRVSGVSVYSSTDGGVSLYEDYNVSNMSTNISLPNSNSSVKYKVSVTNYGNVEAGILSITGLPSNLDYSLENYTLEDRICDSSNKCVLGATKEFYITIKYKSGSYNANSTQFNVLLSFDFRNYYNVSYVNINDSSLPTIAMEGSTLNVSLANSTPMGLETTMNNTALLMGTDYSYDRSNYNLSIPNVSGNIVVTRLNVLLDIVKNIYTTSSKTTVKNNGIVYNYAKSVSMMNDRKGGSTSDYNAGNIRYYGESPQNYVFFNCGDYNNQSTSTCERWRIIGLFKGVTLSDGTTADLLKITRAAVIGNYSWDASQINEWTESDVMKLLNPGYSSSTINGSFYYNSGSGKCYNGINNATTTCNFSSNGLGSTDYNYINTVKWNIGAYSQVETYANVIYPNERGSAVSTSGRKTVWTGPVGLMYPTDYGYAADFSICSENLNNYDVDSNCHDKNWLYTGAAQWLMTPSKDYTTTAWYINSAGYVGSYYNTRYAYGVRPVIYLKANVLSKDGCGSFSDPYHISF